MQGVRLALAALATSLPFSVEPVKMMRSNANLVISIATSAPP